MLSSCFEQAPGQPGEADPFLSDRMLNIAHRGGSLLRPEETMPAFEHALEVGADALEMDLHSTSDGVIVCMHDRSVDRTTDGQGRINEMTFEELRGLDAGYRFTADNGATYPYRGTGVVVPSFEEVLEAFHDRYLIVELKQTEPSIGDPVLSLVFEHDMPGNVILASFNDDVIHEIRSKAPDIHTGLALAEMTALVLAVQDGTEYGPPPARFAQVPQEAVNDSLLEVARSVGLKVHVWTVNDRLTMSLLTEMGVDGIITDDPMTLDEVLQSR